MCLAQGHNAMMLVRLEPAAPQSRVKHSTTEPLRSLYIRFIKQIKSAILFLSSILEKRNKIWYQDVPYNII